MLLSGLPRPDISCVASQLGARVAVIERKRQFGGPTGLTSKAVREAAQTLRSAVDKVGGKVRSICKAADFDPGNREPVYVLLDNPASRRVLEKVGFEDWTEDSIDTVHSGRQPNLATRMTLAEFEEFLFSGGCTAQPQLERSVPAVWVVAAALFDTADRVLVAQRPAGKYIAGLWEFPGGKIEAL